jgi:hypothetical protein
MLDWAVLARWVIVDGLVLLREVFQLGGSVSPIPRSSTDGRALLLPDSLAGGS